MPADPADLDQFDGQARIRADLVAYLDSLPVGELAELLGELPSRRQQPLQLGVLMVALNERLPDAFKLLPPAGQPGPGEGRRRSLRQVVADRRAARTSRHAGPLSPQFAEWFADRQRQADRHAERARAGAVGERTTSARSTAGRRRSRRAPSLGCRWAAITSRSATARIADLGCSRSPGKPRTPAPGACRLSCRVTNSP